MYKLFKSRLQLGAYLESRLNATENMINNLSLLYFDNKAAENYLTINKRTDTIYHRCLDSEGYLIYESTTKLSYYINTWFNRCSCCSKAITKDDIALSLPYRCPHLKNHCYKLFICHECSRTDYNSVLDTKKAQYAENRQLHYTEVFYPKALLYK